MIDLFITNMLSAVWTLILMAPIHCSGSTSEQVMLNSSKSVRIKQQTHLYLGWPISTSWSKSSTNFHFNYFFKGTFYNSPRVKQLSFTVFESIQPISGSGGGTFSIA